MNCFPGRIRCQTSAMSKNNSQSHPYKVGFILRLRSVLRHGFNRLLLFALVNGCVDEKSGRLMAPLDETDAIKNYFSVPVGQWVSKWPVEVLNRNKDLMLLNWGPLVELGAGHKFYITDFCEELADVYRMVETELPQKVLYKQLIRFNQDEYVELRKHIIQNPVIKKEVLNECIRDFGAKYGKASDVKEVMFTAYEDAGTISGECLSICKRCGWTVGFDSGGKGKCHDRRCKSRTNNFTEIDVKKDRPENYYRVKKGIMQFVASPGAIELGLDAKCTKLGFKTELWPGKDTYDLKIKVGEGEYWVVDAKDYSLPFLLKEKIQKDGIALPRGDWEKGFIVIPDERKKDLPSYCKIVDSAINNVGQGGSVRCLSVSEFIKKVKKHVKEVGHV